MPTTQQTSPQSRSSRETSSLSPGKEASMIAVSNISKKEARQQTMTAAKLREQIVHLAEVVTNLTCSIQCHQITNIAGCITNSASNKLQVIYNFTNNVTSSVSSRIFRGESQPDPLIGIKTIKGHK
jgi:hypothetical protein